MRAVALRVTWILSLLCVVFAAAGLVAFSPVTLALSVTGWFLLRSTAQTVRIQGDVLAPTPHAQYWGRALLLRTFVLMASGTAVGYLCVRFHWFVSLTFGQELLLTTLLILSLVTITRFMIPGFFPASWEVHGAPERRQRVRPGTVVARIMVRVVAVVIFVMATVGSFSLFNREASLKSRLQAYSKQEWMRREFAGLTTFLDDDTSSSN